MKPSLHYAQHRDLEAPRVDATAFRPAWRVRSQLDKLLSDRRITRPQWDRACAFRRDLELVLAAAYPGSPDLGAPPASGRNSQLPAIRFDALSRIERVCLAIGAVMCALLRAALVDDLTWTALGARLRVDARTARTWVIAAIKALAAVENS